jgi:predicted membrane protein
LTGERERDLNVSVRGGVGEVVILLPEDVGVQAQVEGGIGEVKADGMSRKDDAYVNEAFGVSETTINLDIQGGVGGVTLEVQE